MKNIKKSALSVILILIMVFLNGCGLESDYSPYDYDNKPYATAESPSYSNKTSAYVSKENESDTDSELVYITPTGIRYHFKSTCGGKNSYSVSLDKAISRGYTPCMKCAN